MSQGGAAGTRPNFVRLPAPGGAEVIIQSERPLPSAAWLVVGQIAELLSEVTCDGV